MCLVMASGCVAYAVYNLISPSLTTDKLLSVIMLMLGFLCFQDFLGKYYRITKIDASLKRIEARGDCGQNINNYVEMTTRREFEEKNQIGERYRNAKEIHMFSHSNYAMFTPIYLDLITSCIESGTVFRFLGFDPDNTEMVKNLKKYKMVSQMDENPPRTSTIKYLKMKLQRGYSDKQIQYNICDIDFPFGMTIVEKRDGETTVKVDLYTLMTDHTDRRCIFLTSNNEGHNELIDFFKHQWKVAWENSRRIPAEIEKKNKGNKA